MSPDNNVCVIKKHLKIIIRKTSSANHTLLVLVTSRADQTVQLSLLHPADLHGECLAVCSGQIT